MDARVHRRWSGRHLEVGGCLDLPDGHHECVAHHDTDVGTRVAVGAFRQLVEVVGCEGVGGVADVELEHASSWRLLGQRDVDTLLEPPPYGRVEPPGNIGRSENKNAVVVDAHALHLHEELGLDSSGGVVL